jgi:hypothetical protein
MELIIPFILERLAKLEKKNADIKSRRCIIFKRSEIEDTETYKEIKALSDILLKAMRGKIKWMKKLN